MTSLAFILGCIFTAILGYLYRDLRDSVKELRDALSKEPELLPIGATMGSYAPVNEYKHTNQEGEVGIAEAKTPQRVAWDAEESLRKEVRGEV